MYPKFRSMINCQALKALTRNPTMPNPAMAVGGDDEMSNVPLVIFRDQHLPMPGPTMEHIYNLPSLNKSFFLQGANDTLSMEDFVTDDFNLGAEYDFLT